MLSLPLVVDGLRSMRAQLRDAERALIREALEQSPTVAAAARLLHCERAWLYRRARALGIEPSRRNGTVNSERV